MMTRLTGVIKQFCQKKELFLQFICLTWHSLPHQWKWALLSPSELDGSPISWAFRRKSYTVYELNPPKSCPFDRTRSGRDFCTHISEKSTERTVLIKFIQPDACCLLTLFAFSLSDFIEQLEPPNTEILQSILFKWTDGLEWSQLWAVVWMKQSQTPFF